VVGASEAVAAATVTRADATGTRVSTASVSMWPRIFGVVGASEAVATASVQADTDGVSMAATVLLASICWVSAPPPDRESEASAPLSLSPSKWGGSLFTAKNSVFNRGASSFGLLVGEINGSDLRVFFGVTTVPGDLHREADESNDLPQPKSPTALSAC
jgi:hypothetical protein